ncbi:hypothetical protein [Paenibacillus piri]|uniref:Uncharacterized protein n=1 Tax=Paenibacillus piri TaxID=2547395 RepID=A0A4R5KK06_9BACL|nr:hypothetical protein [Paenibacillus piri]TDF95168.1 hypothetical protein E1757_21830 [Paenibacillus piri]
MMRKIIVAEFLSLGDVMEEPSWSGNCWNHEIAKWMKKDIRTRGTASPRSLLQTAPDELEWNAKS